MSDATDDLDDAPYRRNVKQWGAFAGEEPVNTTKEEWQPLKDLLKHVGVADQHARSVIAFVDSEVKQARIDELNNVKVEDLDTRITVEYLQNRINTLKDEL